MATNSTNATCTFTDLASCVAAASSRGVVEAAQVADLPALHRLPLLLLRPPKMLFSNNRLMQTNFVGLVSIAGLSFVVGLYIIHIIALIYSKYRLHRKVKADRSLPGVSIIKPLVGADTNLRTNLESFFTMDYHLFEILFCVHSSEDPSVPIVKALMDKYPAVNARIFYKGEKVGLNPKINNMMPAYKAAKYPLVLVSDSAILMRTDTLTDMVATMESDSKMALVTQMPYCKDRQGFGAAFEQVYFGTSHGRIYLAGNCMNFVCSTGMSSMMRKSALDELGGISAFGGYLAEDYFFGRELADKGFKSAISTQPAMQNASNVSISSFLDRICRWIKLRIAMLPHIILVEPLQDCIPSGIIASSAAKYLFGVNPYIYFTVHTIFWFSMDFTLMHSIQNGRLCFSSSEFVLAWILREVSAPFVFLAALCQPTIRWRNNEFKLAWGGRIKSA